MAIGADADPSFRLKSRPRRRRPRLAPIEKEGRLGEVPTPIHHGERVKASELGDHDPALAAFGEDAVGVRLPLAPGVDAIKRDRAMPVELTNFLTASSCSVENDAHRGSR